MDLIPIAATAPATRTLIEPPGLVGALAYARRGWPVFPVYQANGGSCSCHEGSACKHPGKHPRTMHGLNDATCDETKIREWWSHWPLSNVAIATGHGLGVVDIDPRHDGDSTFARLQTEHGELETVEALTGGGGRHLFFSYDGVLSSKNGIAPGVDIKADGGYVLAAPSNHVSGGTYRWDVGHHPNDVPITPAPTSWLGFLRGKRNEPATAVAVIEGGRNDALTSLAGTMRRRNFGEPAILAALREENRTRCVPPLDDREVCKIASSVARYEPERAPSTEPRVTWIGVDEIFAPLPDTRWCIRDLQICPGRPTLFAGYGSSAKTISCQSMLLQYAAGKPVWGWYGVGPGGRVRHFDLEQGRNATLRRFQRLALGAEVNPRDLADRLEVSIFPSVFLNDHDAIDAYSRECEGVDLALIDALRGATPGVDENDSKIRACLDNLTHVSERTGTAFVLIHHSGKPREGHADNRTIPRGSSAIFDAAGCVFVVVGESEGPRHVSQQKTPAEAEGGRIADFYVEVEDVARDGRPTAGVRVVVRTPEQVQPPRKQGAQFEALRSKVVDLVRTESNLTSRNAICNRIVGGSKSAKLDAIAELMDERRLVQPGGDGSPFRLSS